MIERVADVLLNAGCGTSDECEAIARRVIAAMREPTAAMIAASPEEGAGLDEHSRGYAANYWRAMLDAALGESAERDRR